MKKGYFNIIFKMYKKWLNETISYKSDWSNIRKSKILQKIKKCFYLHLEPEGIGALVVLGIAFVGRVSGFEVVQESEGLRHLSHSCL